MLRFRRLLALVTALPILTAALVLPATASAQDILSQNFDNVPALFTVQGGWARVNRSSPAPPMGTGDWHQGAGVFPAHVGAFDACIAADFSSASGFGTISNWLITPTVTLQNGQVLHFFTRTRSPVTAPDRLQVRRSLSGASIDVGTTATSVGVFTTLLLDINPTYTLNAYPTGWTEFTITLSGIAAPTQGRLAFRYFVENGGPAGINSDVIGIDTLTLASGATNPCLLPLPPCNGDVAPTGGNGVVNVDDLLAVITTWGLVGPPRPQGDTAPLPNGNCTVNVDDLLAVITTWGICPTLGACCLPSGQCTNAQSPNACATAGGVYQGNNSTCALANCPQPNNDICTQAHSITIPGSATGNLETAQQDLAPACNNVQTSRGRWYRVVGNGTTLTASICASTGLFDGRLSVYCGPHCSALLCVTAADANSCSTNKETVSWCSRNGQTYWILVHAPAIAAGQGAYTLLVSGGGTCTGAALCAPANDLCANNIPISNGLTAFSTVGATTDGNPVAPGACNDSGQTQCVADIWYRYTATCTGTLRVTTCSQLGGSTTYDSDIVIYLNVPCPPPDSARIGCNDDDPINLCGTDPPFASTAFAPVQAGQTYLIRVGGFADEVIDFGTGMLNITCTP